MNQATKHWQQFRPDPDLSANISKRSDISSVISQILINRGIESDEQARAFLEPKLSSLRDPGDIPHISLAAKRVLLAKERSENVCVFGDYDVDGVTGTAILLETFKSLGINCSYYIPHRYDEGYGMNADAIKEIFASGAKLIVTVDCGISNQSEVELANSLGMEVVVTDHHNPPENLPSSVANVNPKLLKSKHPSKELSGAGVAFKFAWALMRSAGIKESGMLLSLLDLVCLGTIADVVPLLDENRILASQGLETLSLRKRPGLRALLDVAGVSGKVSATHVNFAIAPRINAAGRLEKASIALDLLMSREENEARTLAGNLNRINVKRQAIGSKISQEVFAALKGEDTLEPIIVVSGNGWHPGVIGIIASQVVEAFSRPAVLIGVCDGMGRGSARSINGVNIFELLKSCGDLFKDFGGHENAAGFELDPLQIPAFASRLKAEAKAKIKIEELTPKIIIDAQLEPSAITMGLAKELEVLAPFGRGNPQPVFVTKGLKVTDFRPVGDGSHLKAKFSDGTVSLDTIGFGLFDLSKKLNFSSSYDIAYTLRSNEWNGFESVELRLLDLKEAMK